ncbi:MAG: putative quinol monooxygenase [Candidatus Pelagibacter sp.]|jgi:quinol monooxygenase YgiN|tara:strand:- start:598 stop:906 length:309 start_codon:yes stop_codon:yes gene_type:complete
MDQIIILASFYPKQDKINDVKKIIFSMIEPSRSEEGNQIYNFYEEKDEKNNKIIFHLFEVYSHAKALDFHRSTDYYKDYRLKISDLLEKPIEVKILNSLNST